MSNKELTKLALKVFSIYVMVQALLAIPQFFQTFVIFSDGSKYDSENWFIAISIISVVLLIVLSVFIWNLSNNISRTTTSENTASSSNISEEFILSVLGLYLVVYGLIRVSITSTSVYHLLKTASDGGIDYGTNHNIVYLVVYFVVTVLGLSLIIKTNGWLRLLNKLRLAGT